MPRVHVLRRVGRHGRYYGHQGPRPDRCCIYSYALEARTLPASPQRLCLRGRARPRCSRSLAVEAGGSARHRRVTFNCCRWRRCCCDGDCEMEPYERSERRCFPGILRLRALAADASVEMLYKESSTSTRRAPAEAGVAILSRAAEADLATRSRPPPRCAPRASNRCRTFPRAESQPRGARAVLAGLQREAKVSRVLLIAGDRPGGRRVRLSVKVIETGLIPQYGSRASASRRIRKAITNIPRRR